MKHFGFLKNIEFNESNRKKITDLLIDEGLFEMKLEAKGNNSSIKDGKLELKAKTDTVIIEPSDALVDEFYKFIMTDVLKHKIWEDKLEFFNLLNNQIFGLEPLEQKKIALVHFNKIYDDIFINVATPYENKISETGINHTYNFGKLQMLYYQLNGFKNNLADKIKLDNYLTGNREFLTMENLIENFDIENEIRFEVWVQIVVELNDRFKFEEDAFFTKIKLEKDLYNKYTHIFKTFESLQFTCRKIEKFESNKKANIESLYQVLIKHELIKDHKENFIEFIKNEFDIPISKIISYDEKENYAHDKRVQLLTEEWLKLAVKNK